MSRLSDLPAVLLRTAANRLDAYLCRAGARTAGSTTPGVLESDVTYPAKFAKAGWIKPLTSFKCETGRFFPTEIEAGTYKRTPYAAFGGKLTAGSVDSKGNIAALEWLQNAIYKSKITRAPPPAGKRDKPRKSSPLGMRRSQSTTRSSPQSLKRRSRKGQIRLHPVPRWAKRQAVYANSATPSSALKSAA